MLSPQPGFENGQSLLVERASFFSAALGGVKNPKVFSNSAYKVMLSS